MYSRENPAKKIDGEIATSRCRTGKMVSSSEGHGEVLGTTKLNQTFGRESDDDILALRHANVATSKQKVGGAKGLQREFT